MDLSVIWRKSSVRAASVRSASRSIERSKASWKLAGKMSASGAALPMVDVVSPARSVPQPPKINPGTIRIISTPSTVGDSRGPFRPAGRTIRFGGAATPLSSTVATSSARGRLAGSSASIAVVMPSR